MIMSDANIFGQNLTKLLWQKHKITKYWKEERYLILKSIGIIYESMLWFFQEY